MSAATTAPTWAATLDDFARTLADQRTALARGAVDDISPFTPPAGLGPLPVELAERAGRLLTAADALTRDLQQATTASQRELSMLGRMRPTSASSPSASYVDSSL